MNKKVVIIGVIAIILLIIVYFIANPPAAKPEEWIETKPDGVQEINVSKVTRGAGFTNAEGLQYDDGEILTAFGYDGMYNGAYFPSQTYFDALGEPKLRITTDLDPNNGIPEGWIAEYIEGKDVIAYIFVDEDWKNQIGNTNIIWGTELQFIKKFMYNPLSTGVYMDSIIDDPERFNKDYTERDGGIVVGNADSENAMYDNWDGTIIIRLV